MSSIILSKSDYLISPVALPVACLKNVTNCTLTVEGLSVLYPLLVIVTVVSLYDKVIVKTSFPSSVSFVIKWRKNDTNPVPVVVNID
jgi:hypothetical protein